MPVRPHSDKRRAIPFFGVPEHLKAQMTARIWSKTDLFARLCQQQDVKPTVRQARKFFQQSGRWAEKRNREVWTQQSA